MTLRELADVSLTPIFIKHEGNYHELNRCLLDIYGDEKVMNFNYDVYYQGLTVHLGMSQTVLELGLGR